jgi:glycosyltransferase involved in cell wall biosynthesis
VNLRITAIVPCRNEAGSIGSLIEGLFSIGVARVIVAVDPNCTDETAAVSAHHCASVVRAPVSGYDGPVLAGLAALDADATHVLFLDAGGKYHLDSIEALLEQANPLADMTFGVRDLQVLWHQKLGNNLFALMLWIRFQRHRCKDVSSVRLLRVDVIPRLRLEDRQFSLPFQTIVHGLKQGMTIDYISIRCTKDRIGNSKISGSIRNSVTAGRRMLMSIAKAPDF